MTPDELWKKYQVGYAIRKDDFLAALKEYGAEVRKRDADKCNKEAKRLADIGFHNESHTASNNAAAIAREPLP